MNKHFYTLRPGPFALIKSGNKTVEMRLFDEKRKLLRVGDTIIFSNTETQEELTVIVVKLEPFKDFVDLYNNFTKGEIGYSPNENAKPSDMELYYSKDAISTHGVLAISIMKVSI